MQKVSRRTVLRTLATAWLSPILLYIDPLIDEPILSAAFDEARLIARNIPNLTLTAELAAVSTGTFQNFDVLGTGTPYAKRTHVPPPTSGPALIDGGPTEIGKLMRLAFADPPIPTHNSITFDRTNPGTFGLIVADFDFRMTPGKGRADGLGFALLDTAIYDTTGIVDPQGPLFADEEPNFQNSLGIGFDIHRAIDRDEISDNHISIHFNGNLVKEFDVSSAVILGGGQWIHARIIMRPGGNYSDVTVILTQCGRPATTVISQFKIPGFSPYEGRVHFAARAGGESANHDIDNVQVQFLNLPQSILAFSTGCYFVLETDDKILITVNRTDKTENTVTVDYATSNNTAYAGSNYLATSGTLIFNPGEVTKTFVVSILDDATNEGHKSFLVGLSNPTGSDVMIGGPAMAKVIIIDDETTRQEGYWHDPFTTQIVAVHAHLLPNGKVMFWPGDEGEEGSEGTTFDDPRIWDPNSETFKTVKPSHNLFCSGHAFLADGRLLVTGGHRALNEGLPDASSFDHCTDLWTALKAMNEGRWYPTNTTLTNGDILVVSGAVMNEPFKVNELPQVWDIELDNWRDLENATFQWQLYPFMFLAPNGQVFNAGPNPDTQYVDTSGTGKITPGPVSSRFRSDGSAVMYDDGKILIVGGSDGADPPTNTAEVINLNASNSQWVQIESMASPRKYHNATILADGTVLVTGGTSSAEFNNASEAVLAAELWDPQTDKWTPLAEMQIQRVYHSIALLLPDARVFVAGGGQPSPTDHANNKDAQIFSPPYLFQGPRPKITSAPGWVPYNHTFFVQTPDANSIDKVNWIRLSSVTHAFNQNQRINRLNFEKVSGGVNVTTPFSANLAPPGHYMLFILNDQGVPSVAHIIQVGPRFIGLCKANLPYITKN